MRILIFSLTMEPIFYMATMHRGKTNVLEAVCVSGTTKVTQRKQRQRDDPVWDGGIPYQDSCGKENMEYQIDIHMKTP